MQKPLFQTCFFEDLAVGMRETISKTVENEDVIGFAELSGDHNPIHLSEHFARKTRFGGRIVHGLYMASLISGVIGMRLPGPGAVYISQTLNFLRSCQNRGRRRRQRRGGRADRERAARPTEMRMPGRREGRLGGRGRPERASEPELETGVSLTAREGQCRLPTLRGSNGV